MKALIKLEAVRHGFKEGIEVGYDSANPPTIWLEIRSDPGLKVGEPGHVNTRCYRLVVGEKGGLTLQ